jgi:hypothetical protein
MVFTTKVVGLHACFHLRAPYPSINRVNNAKTFFRPSVKAKPSAKQMAQGFRDEWMCLKLWRLKIYNVNC